MSDCQPLLHAQTRSKNDHGSAQKVTALGAESGILMPMASPHEVTRLLKEWANGAQASIESHLDSDDQDLVKDARRDLLRYVTAGDPPQIKMEAPTNAASGDFTLAELLGTLKMITDAKQQAKHESERESGC
jgi:hypothetical protein